MSYCMLASDEWFFHNLHLSIHFSFHHHFYDFYFWRDCFFSSFFGTFLPGLWVNVSSLLYFCVASFRFFSFFLLRFFIPTSSAWQALPGLPRISGAVYTVYTQKSKDGVALPQKAKLKVPYVRIESEHFRKDGVALPQKVKLKNPYARTKSEHFRKDGVATVCMYTLNSCCF